MTFNYNNTTIFKEIKIKEAMQQYALMYRLKNADKLKEQRKQYRLENADKINEKAKKYRLENPDKIRKYNKKYYDNKLFDKHIAALGSKVSFIKFEEGDY